MHIGTCNIESDEASQQFYIEVGITNVGAVTIKGGKVMRGDAPEGQSTVDNFSVVFTRPIWTGEELYAGNTEGDDNDDDTTHEALATDVAPNDTDGQQLDEATMHDILGNVAPNDNDNVVHPEARSPM
jgi:hypothetical protein